MRITTECRGYVCLRVLIVVLPTIKQRQETQRAFYLTHSNLINNYMKSKTYNFINSILDLGYKIAIIGWFGIELYYFVNNI